MNIDAISRQVSEWAKNEPLIKRIHFFGSRVKGTYTNDSDLDIAITLDVNSDEENEAFSVWCHHSDKWQNELNRIIPYDVQIEWEAGSETPTISKGLNEANFLVYEN